MDSVKDKRNIPIPENRTSVLVKEDGCFFYFLEKFDLLVAWNPNEKELHYPLLRLRNWEMSPCTMEKEFLYNDELIGVHIDGKEITSVSISRGVVYKTVVEADGRPWGNFALIDKYGDSIYCFTKETGKVIVYDCGHHLAYESQIMKRPAFLGFSYQDRAYLFPYVGNYVYLYNYLDNNVRCIMVEHPFYETRHIFCGDDILYELQSRIILKRNTEDFQVVDEIDFPYGSLSSRIITAGEYLMVLPGTGENIYIINQKTNAISVYSEYPEGFHYYPWFGNKANKYSNYYEDAERYYFPHRASEYILEIEKSSGELNWLKTPPIDADIKMAYLTQTMPIVREGDASLEWFLDMVK